MNGPSVLGLKTNLRREHSLFVAECDQLKIVTNGQTVEEAEQRIEEAIFATLRFAAIRGNLNKFLSDRGLPSDLWAP